MRPEDFSSLLEETENMIYSLGIRLFRNEEDALDFSQEVYLKAFHKISTFENRSKFSTWLYRLALNHGLNELKKSKKLNLVFSDTEETVDNLFYHSINAVSSDPFHEFSEKEMQEAVQCGLEELPDGYRVPILLYYYDNLSYEEIAKLLKQKEGTIKSNIHRGKKLLRSVLSKKAIN